MKKNVGRIVLAVVMLLMLVVVGGCGKQSDEGQKTSDGDSSKLSGTLTVAGSTSVQPFSEVLAEEFQNQNPDVKINIQGGGSSQGVEAAISGAADIGSASRDLKDDEKTQADLVVTPIAVDGVAVVVNPDSKVTALKMEDIKNIYLGNIKNWKELGGDDAPITVVSREEGSGTRDCFSEIVMDKEDIINTAIVQNSTGAVRTTVAGDKNAIGYVSLASVNDEVKALDLDGVKASEANVKNGTYKLQRPFIYITNGQPSGLSKSFIDFVLSDEGQDIIVEEGAFKVK